MAQDADRNNPSGPAPSDLRQCGRRTPKLESCHRSNRSHVDGSHTGANRTGDSPRADIFTVTGNNLVLGGDLPRRCYWIRVDAQLSEPWRDRTFKHPKLTAWVLDNRGQLLSAILTLARAWSVAGQPSAAIPVLGSFEEWCRIIGGILDFAGIEGFLANLDELYKQSDPFMAAWEAFLAGLLEI